MDDGKMLIIWSVRAQDGPSVADDEGSYPASKFGWSPFALKLARTSCNFNSSVNKIVVA